MIMKTINLMFARKKIALLFLVLPVFLFHIQTQGQEVTDSEEITVVAPYQPAVSEAFKINVSPRVPDENLTKPDFKYEILTKEFKAEPEFEAIKPAKISGESVSKLYKNYARVGFGNYATPYLELFANKLRSKKNAFGVHLKHISSAGKIKDYAYPGSSNTFLSAYGKKFMPKHTLTTDVYYDRRGAHFYGYRPDDFPGISLENKDIRQTYNKIGFQSDLASNYSDNEKAHHKILLGYSYLFDRFEAKEHRIAFDADLDVQTGFFDFSEKESLGIDLGVEYFLASDSVSNHNRGIIYINPYYSFGFDQYYFKVGLNTAIESDSGAKGHFYPIVRAEIKVIRDYLITYAGIYGKLEQNSMHSYSEENPFIISTIEKGFTNNKISQYGGIKGRISKSFDYNVSFINSTVRNMPLFVNDTVSALGEGLNNQFTVVYDDVKHTRLQAEFGYQYQDRFKILLRGQFNDYFLDNEDEAWHKPGLEISLGARYNIQEKIYARAEIFTRSKMYAKTYVPDVNSGDLIVYAEKLKGYVDLNLGFEYRYSNVLSGFLNLNNLLGQRYYHWYNYPSYRFNFMLGVTYSF